MNGGIRRLPASRINDAGTLAHFMFAWAKQRLSIREAASGVPQIRLLSSIP